MSRNRNSKKLAATPKGGTRGAAEPDNRAEAVARDARTDESVVRQVSRDDAPRTLRTGAPIAALGGSDVLEALGSNGAVGRAMHDILYAPDDEKVLTRLGPEQEASVAFRPDQALGDAGAEFAEEFGRDFLMAATAGEDFSEIYSASTAEPADVSEPYLQEVGMSEIEDVTEFAEPIDEDDDNPPSR